MTKQYASTAAVLLTFGVLIPTTGCSRTAPAPTAAAPPPVAGQPAPVSPEQAKEMEATMRRQKQGD